jgi:addiction module RelE/StbE family toxin
MLILRSAQFIRKAAKLDQRLRNAFTERMKLFGTDPNHPILNNHKLHGKRRHQRSINITGDWRLVYEQVDSDTIRLIDIDTHANLYGS